MLSICKFATLHEICYINESVPRSTMKMISTSTSDITTWNTYNNIAVSVLHIQQTATSKSFGWHTIAYSYMVYPNQFRPSAKVY